MWSQEMVVLIDAQFEQMEGEADVCRCVFLQENKTPFDLAVDKGNTEVVRMIADFREHGPMALASYEKGPRKRSATAPATSLTPSMQQRQGKETVSLFSSLHARSLLW